MTYLTNFTQRIFQEPILGTQFLSLALISLVLIALQATPAHAQWTLNSPNITTTNNVGIGTTTPGAPLQVGTGTSYGTTHGLLVSPNLTGATYDRSFQMAPTQTVAASGNSVLMYVVPTIASGVTQSTMYGLYVDSKQGPGAITNYYPAIFMGGNVGIGIGTPSVKLHVVGDGKFTGSLTVDGNIAAKYQDVAEWVPASEKIPAGTVVVLDSTKSNHVIASTRGYDTRVAGVISAQPGIVLGEPGDSKVLVATTGRVRIKVDASHGPIGVGDLLVTSKTPGMAMKSQPLSLSGVQIHRPGTLIGKALEPLAKGQGEILVLLSLQ